MVEKEGRGVEDQYAYTCCAAEHLGRQCVLFGVRIAEDGSTFAIIGFPQEVPADEVATYSRKLTTEQENK